MDNAYTVFIKDGKGKELFRLRRFTPLMRRYAQRGLGERYSRIHLSYQDIYDLIADCMAASQEKDPDLSENIITHNTGEPGDFRWLSEQYSWIDCLDDPHHVCVLRRIYRHLEKYLKDSEGQEISLIIEFIKL